VPESNYSGRNRNLAGDSLRAKFNVKALFRHLECGHRTATSSLGLTPYAAAQVTAFDLSAYAERTLAGASTFALN
jgi:hypothetical protein